MNKEILWSDSLAARVFFLVSTAMVALFAGCVEDDPGRWVEVEAPTTGSLTGLWGFSSSEIYAVGSEYDADTGAITGILLEYDGVDWSRSLEVEDCALSSVWGASSNELYASGACVSPEGEEFGAVIVIGGDGFEKVEISADRVGPLFGLGPEDVYVVSGVDVLRFDGSNSAVVWQGTPLVGEVGDVLFDLWGADGRMFVVGGEMYGGSAKTLVAEMAEGEWSRRVDDEIGVLRGIGGSGGRSVAVGVNRGCIGDDVGIVLERKSSGWSTKRKLDLGWHEDAWVGEDGEIMVIGQSPRIMRYSSGEWREMDCPTDQMLLDVWGVDGKLFAVGSNGAVIERVRD